jgi:hypothetical protein
MIATNSSNGRDGEKGRKEEREGVPVEEYKLHYKVQLTQIKVVNKSPPLW